jgi:Ni2+-binding GTPase involved in maturation of urease and hydrogenase
MRMEQVEVFLSAEGQIVIKQDDPSLEDADIIFINKEQAALVCEWIMAAAKEAK